MPFCHFRFLFLNYVPVAIVGCTRQLIIIFSILALLVFRFKDFNDLSSLIHNGSAEENFIFWLSQQKDLQSFKKLKVILLLYHLQLILLIVYIKSFILFPMETVIETNVYIDLFNNIRTFALSKNWTVIEINICADSF